MFLIAQSLQCSILMIRDNIFFHLIICCCWDNVFFLFIYMLLFITIMDNKLFASAILHFYVFLQIVSYRHSWCIFANVQWHNFFSLLSQFYDIMLWHIVILRCLEVLHRKNALWKCSWSVLSYSSQDIFPSSKSMWQCRGHCHHVGLVFIITWY